MATLTFSGDLADDTTPALLAELRELGAAATFFLPASSARGHATLVRSLVAAGHEVGCLGLEGAHYTSETVADIAATTAALTAVTGTAPVWYRPQDASRDVTVLRAANAAGLRVALCSVCPYDWDAREEDVARRVATQVGDTQRGADGAVGALSSTPPAHLLAPGAAGRAALPPLDALRATVRALRAASPGLRFVTLSTAAA